MADERAVHLLGARQHGAFSRRQLRALGMSRAVAARAIGRGRLIEMTPRVVVARGAPATALQRVMIAVLDVAPAAVASHRTAAWLWRLPGFDERALEVTWLRGYQSSSHGEAIVHRPRLILPQHVTMVDGVPVTSLGRTVFDLAGTRMSRQRLERIVDNVITKSPAMCAVLHRTRDELACRGRSGLAVMRSILAERPPGAAVAASGLERRFEEILAAAGEPLLERQVDVGGHEWIGRIDYVDRALRLLVEIDSVVHHTSLVDARLDALRDEAALAAGYLLVLRIPEYDIWHRPWTIAPRVRAARAACRSRLAA